MCEVVDYLHTKQNSQGKQVKINTNGVGDILIIINKLNIIFVTCARGCQLRDHGTCSFTEQRFLPLIGVLGAVSLC